MWNWFFHSLYRCTFPFFRTAQFSWPLSQRIPKNSNTQSAYMLLYLHHFMSLHIQEKSSKVSYLQFHKYIKIYIYNWGVFCSPIDLPFRMKTFNLFAHTNLMTLSKRTAIHSVFCMNCSKVGLVILKSFTVESDSEFLPQAKLLLACMWVLSDWRHQILALAQLQVSCKSLQNILRTSYI